MLEIVTLTAGILYLLTCIALHISIMDSIGENVHTKTTALMLTFFGGSYIILYFLLFA